MSIQSLLYGLPRGAFLEYEFDGMCVPATTAFEITSAELYKRVPVRYQPPSLIGPLGRFLFLIVAIIFRPDFHTRHHGEELLGLICDLVQ